MMPTTYRAIDVAHYFLALSNPDENDISNLKLQKLCYYAQGFVSAMRGAPLFSDRIEAWDHGPVIPNVYHVFKMHGSAPIPFPGNANLPEFDSSDARALQDVYEYYAQYSAWRLRNMTHEDRPWVEAHNRADKVITPQTLIEHFRPLIEDDYLATVYGQGANHKAA